MSVWDRIRQLMSRAKEGAADVAQAANLKLDIRGLEGRRDHLLREMGRTALKMQQEGHGIPVLESACSEIAQVERQIREKQAELAAVRTPPPAGNQEQAPAG